MVSVNVSQNLKNLFLKRKAFVNFDKSFDNWGGRISFDQNLLIEPYTLQAQTRGRLLSIGMCSYIHGSVLPSDTIIGRYSSIANGVSVMPTGHPIERFTSSPVSYRTTEFGFNPLSSRFENGDFEIVEWEEKRGQIIIGNDVWIGEDVMLKPGVHIGDGAVIAARAVVTKDVEPYSIVGGVPARKIKSRFTDNVVEELVSLQWWKYPYWSFDNIRGDEPIESFISKMKELIRTKSLQPLELEVLTAKEIMDVG
jgi:acetyltransferase-like isoleucine patch superfamily enzyme